MVVHYLTQYAKINILNHRFFNHDSKNYLDKKKSSINAHNSKSKGNIKIYYRDNSPSFTQVNPTKQLMGFNSIYFGHK